MKGSGSCCGSIWRRRWNGCRKGCKTIRGEKTEGQKAGEMPRPFWPGGNWSRRGNALAEGLCGETGFGDLNKALEGEGTGADVQNLLRYRICSNAKMNLK